MEWIKILHECYSVSGNGLIRNDLTGKILKVRIDSKGYHKCNLYNGKGDSKGYLVHRLVAKYFIGDPTAGQTQVNHIDGNPLNNHYSNLEWCTPKENSEHAVRIGLFPGGETHHFSKITDDEIRNIRKLHASGEYSQAELGRIYGINQSEISRYIHFKRRGGRCA